MPRTTKKIEKKTKAPVKRRSRKPAVLKSVMSSTGSVAHGHSTFVHTTGYNEHEEKTKRLIMWLSVSVTMAIIVGIWIVNLNRIVGASELLPKSTNQSKLDFTSIKNDLHDTLSQVQNSLKQMQPVSSQAAPTETAQPIITPTATPEYPATLPN